MRNWLNDLTVETRLRRSWSRAACGSGTRLENGYVESANDKLRDELPNVETFDTLREAQVLAECWRKHCNTEKAPLSRKRDLRFLR